MVVPSNESTLILLKTAVLELTMGYPAEFEGPHVVRVRHSFIDVVQLEVRLLLVHSILPSIGVGGQSWLLAFDMFCSIHELSRRKATVPHVK